MMIEISKPLPYWDTTKPRPSKSRFVECQSVRSLERVAEFDRRDQFSGRVIGIFEKSHSASPSRVMLFGPRDVSSQSLSEPG